MDSVPKGKKTREALAADFVHVSRLAEDAGASVVECDLARSSMPGVTGGACCGDPGTAIEVVTAVREELKESTRLLIKLNNQHRDVLEHVVVPLASKGLIDGVSGISPARLDAMNADGSQLTPKRLAGVAGLAIRQMGLTFVESLAAIRRENGLCFDIIGMGGVMGPEDVAGYMERGADAVQAASASRVNPALAVAAERFVRDRSVGVLHRVDRSRREAVLRRVHESLTPEQQVMWLRSSNASLGGERPVDFLEAGGDVDLVTTALDIFDAGGFD